MVKVMEYFRQDFEKRMQAKTGWGRNEIMLAFVEAQAMALNKRFAEKLEEKGRGE